MDRELKSLTDMRISLNWLRELVEFDMDPEVLAEALTMAGFEVEEIEDRWTWADGVVLGKVTSCKPHPNADRLRVCQVDMGLESTLNIVCGLQCSNRSLCTRCHSRHLLTEG